MTDSVDRPFLARFAVRLDAEGANEDATSHGTHACGESATGTTRKTGVGNETTDDD